MSSLSVTGSLRADEEVLVSAKVAGRVQAVHADFGEEVAADYLLLEVDASDYALLLREAEAAFIQSLAALGLAELPEREFDPERTPAVRKAIAARDNLALRAARGERLALGPQPVISEQDLADLRAALLGGEAELELQRQNARAAFAQARLLEARMLTAAQRLADTAHRAPKSAASPSFRVAQRMAAIGDYVAVGDPLFRLVDDDPLRLRVRIPERHLGAVAVGQEVGLRVEASEREFLGTVMNLSPEVQVTTRSFEVEVRVANSERILRPGSFATASIRTGSEPRLMVPAACVRRFAGVHKLLLVHDGIVEELRVQLGVRDGEWVEILSGIEPGELLIHDPDPALVSGSAVVAAP